MGSATTVSSNNCNDEDVESESDSDDDSDDAYDDYHHASNFLLDAAESDADGSSMDIISDNNLDSDYNFSQLSTTTNSNTTAYKSVKMRKQNLDHIFAHVKYLNKSWILLDNQSTVHIFHNKNILSNIREVPRKQHLMCHTNGGSQLSIHKAKFWSFGDVWFNENSLANILSFSKVRKLPNFSVDYLQHNNTFVITTPSKEVLLFIESSRGLYFFDIRWKKAKCHDFVFVNTLRDNMSLFAPRQVTQAEKARDLYILLGRPSSQNFRYMITHNLIKNTDVNVSDVVRAEKIFGPDLGCLKGKMVRSAPALVVPLPLLSVPPPVFENHKHITLCADIFYVDGQMFFFTISRAIQFKTVQHITTKKHDTIFDCFEKVITTYKKRGFLIQYIFTDSEFQPLAHRLLAIGSE